MCVTPANFLLGFFMERVLAQLALDFACYGQNMTHQLYWHIVLINGVRDKFVLPGCGTSGCDQVSQVWASDFQ